MKKWREGPERDIDISRRSMDRKTKEERNRVNVLPQV